VTSSCSQAFAEIDDSHLQTCPFHNRREQRINRNPFAPYDSVDFNRISAEPATSAARAAMLSLVASHECGKARVDLRRLAKEQTHPKHRNRPADG
jgi:hypothetical protein